jgi:amino acid transporter
MKFWLSMFFSDKNAHKLAAEEVFFVCIISLLPLFALPVIDELRGTQQGPFSLGGLLFSAISAGQLYLYSFTLFGTLFWLCQNDHEFFERFPPRRYLMLLVLVPAALILIVYSFDPSMSKPLSQRLVRISVVVYLLYVVLYYVLLVFDNLSPPDLEAQLDQKAKGLIADYVNDTGNQQ